MSDQAKREQWIETVLAKMGWGGAGRGQARLALPDQERERPAREVDRLWIENTQKEKGGTMTKPTYTRSNNREVETRTRISHRFAVQMREVYTTMAEKAKYRPAAPSDGLGNITVEEDTCEFFVGTCHHPTRPATVYAVEAARILNGGTHKGDHARKSVVTLLKLAIANVEGAQ